MFKAVLWDFGGVITSSPFEAFNRFESEHNLPKDFIRGINATNPETNAWAQLESSQVSVEEFDELFAREARDKGHEIRGKQVLELLSGDIRPEMVSALKRIKQDHAIGCITNNVNTGEGPGMARSENKASAIAEIMSLFEIVVESSKVGIRKPNPAIYELACEQMNIKPDQAVYLDDLGINLKPARALGMTTIKVFSADQALDELEQHLGLTLR
ncbi:MAG: HAD-IA family hydrolase [Pseudomonadales bacterium]|nr:HAD-IA family hydrolase [Pseudomonadales bacterium]MBO6595355.1 HAD-IA family hydrolase [Pseudomonadales bacterium]MBO6701856.1 HAD-IA family hydrolase [Pseudomonadales bacterium]MBO6821086.1 HAD-IA family hydrolase [Pseudomonadales bacterium]MBO7005453.1 HAD-IA family hydrolase [Pseudomonadales bacterium]